MPLLVRFLRDSKGATAIEYAVVATLIAVVIVSGVRAVGSNLQANFWGPIANNLS